MSKKITIIAAYSKNKIIGKNGVLPWNIKEDFTRFLNIVRQPNTSCIMGLNVYNDLNNIGLYPFTTDNIIISKTLKDNIPLTKITSNIEEAINLTSYNKVYILGGYNIYKYYLEYATHMQLTKINDNYEGDVYFPNFDKSKWIKNNKTKLFNILDKKNNKYVDILFIDYFRK